MAAPARGLNRGRWNADGMGVRTRQTLRLLVLGVLFVAPAVAQDEPPKPRPAVQFDDRGWPVLPAEAIPATTPPAAPATESRGAPAGSAPAPAPGPMPPTAMPLNPVPLNPMPLNPSSAASQPSGMQLGSPLLDVFQATRSPAAFQELGGVIVSWRLTVHGSGGEVLGTREVTHTADCAFPERDRLEFADGRTYGRLGAQVFVERQGLPWPTLVDSAQHDLALFGLHLRWPFCFGDAEAYAVLQRDVVTQSGERLTRLVVERRPPAALEMFGPEADPKPRDRFELFCDASSGQPRELVHRLAASLQTRRVVLEDWREVHGVRLPFRRVYVDESMRATTTLELLRLERRRTTERDFRLH
jgi:hypothetical protein